MNYDMYLFSNLLKIYDADFEKLPYDNQFDILPALYQDFEDSKFNLISSGAHECITNYLNNRIAERLF